MHTTSAPNSPSVEVLRPEPGVALIALRGEHDLATAPDLQQTVNDAFANCSHLIIDLSAAEFIDSSIIRVLLSTKRRADEAGCSFNLVLSTTPIVERALEVTQVLHILNRVESLDQALGSAA